MGRLFTMVVGTRGQAYRDLRGDMMADAMWENLQLPAALFYQPDNVPAHHGAIRVGNIYTIDLGENPGDEITAAGEFFDGRAGMERIQGPASEAIALAAEGSIWPSVDPSVIELATGEDGEAAVIRADIPGVTLVSMPGFTGTSITLLPEDPGVPDEVAEDMPADMPVVAAAQDLVPEFPVALRDHPWDGAAAADRIAEHCGVDADGADDGAWECYGTGFLYRDDTADPATKGAYKLGYADIIDGEFTVVPAGVIAVAAVLQGARGGADIPGEQQETLRDTVGTLYERINEALDTDLTPPWEEAESALIAAAVATVREPIPADAFAEPPLDGYQPGYRIEGGRIYGHLTNRAACHRSWPASCVTPPESASNYAVANRYEVITSEGPLEVGRVTTGLGAVGSGCTCHGGGIIDDHYCPSSRSAAAAIAHYDQCPTVADVMIGENESGSVWVAGIMRPVLPADAARVLQRRVWSGDWRPWGTGSELIEVLALDHAEPGFTHRTKHNAAAFTLIAATGPAPLVVESEDDTMRRIVREELEREREAESHRRSLAAAASRSALAAITRN